MSYADQLFIDMCRDIMENGTSTEGEKVRPHWEDGTAAYTIKKFGVVNRYDLRKEFPALTLRKTALKSAMDEILWIWQKKSNNIHDLHSHIWDEWAFKKWVESDEYQGPDMTDFGHRWLTDPAFKAVYLAEKKTFCERILADDEFAARYGNLGDVYGAQWRHWQTRRGETIDQIKNVIEDIKTTPDSRRLIVSAWNPEDVPAMALPPCHTLFQFYVNDGKLSCQLYQRSADIFLGVPFNIASYALLTHLIAKECGLAVGEFIHTLGDAHLYSNHLEQIREQLARPVHQAPQLILPDHPMKLSEYTPADIQLANYEHEAAIKAPVAV